MADVELAALLDISAVEALAGPRSFERGVDYLATGRIGAITASDDAIGATVQGTDAYSVRISAQDRRIFSFCSMFDAAGFVRGRR